MAKFSRVKSPETKEIHIEGFRGIDLRNAPYNVAEGRSPYCPNMIRETKGVNKKRYGYQTISEYDGRINGAHTLKGEEEKLIIHAGTKMYEGETVLYEGAGDHFSISRQVKGKLYILDGLNYLVYDGTEIKKVSEDAYIPTIIIARLHNGGGEALEPVNLIQPKRIERFTGDNTNKTFQLTATNIDEDEVTIKSLQTDGTFSDLVEGTDFTVDRTLGTFTLNAVAQTPVVGEDNLYVTYSKTVAGYADRIALCDMSILYGPNGERNIMIVTGNPALGHYDWHSKADDPTYFGDIWYSVVGQDSSKIINYAIINDRLATLKDDKGTDSTIIRSFEYTDGRLVLTSKGSFQAGGALGKYSFASFDNEPLYLTVDKNISAITPSDVLGERFSQERSYYISTALAKEENLEEGYAVVFEGFYMIAVGEKIYILDSYQPVYEKNTPYSNRQYECYLWEGIGARTLWVHDDRLYFGTADGKVKRFFNESDAKYLDDGETFPCFFDTFEIYDTNMELKKTFKHIAVLLASHIRTGCRIWFKIDGIWEMFFDYDETANFLDFGDIDLSKFTFRTDDTPTIVGGKMKIKKVLHTQIRFENSKDEAFGIYGAVLKYTSGGEYIK